MNDEMESKARSRGKHALSFLAGRIELLMRRRLAGTDSPDDLWWFAIEEDKSGRLHLHGEIAFAFEHRQAVRDALKAAVGLWLVTDEKTGKIVPSPRQLRFKAMPDAGWAGYSVKNAFKAANGFRRFMRRYGSPKRWSVSFEGKAVAASGRVRALAKQLHREALKAVCAARH